MKISVEVEKDVESLSCCLKKINNEINDIADWAIAVNAGGIDYGIYLNLDSEGKELEICNQPAYDEADSLEEAINRINEEENV